MKEFWETCRGGFPMTRRNLWKWLQAPIFLAGLAAIIYVPLGLPQVEPLWFRAILWVLLLMVILIVAICVGLTPYWGQKAITDKQTSKHKETLEEKDKVIGEKDRVIRDYTSDFFRVNKENEELKQQLKNR